MKFKLIILYFVTVVKSVPLRVEEIKNERLQNLSTLSLPSNATSIRADITDNFSCNNKSYGYYADIENDCQIFHVCLPVQYSDSKERIFRWSFICPDETVFSQQSFTCVRSEDLISDCSESEKYYDLNKNFGISSEEENSEENYKGVNSMISSKKPLQQQQQKASIHLQQQFVQPQQQQQQQQQEQQQQRFTTITTAPSFLKENVEEYDESDKTITAKTISIPDIELITATSIKQRIEISPTESNLNAIDIEQSETINDNNIDNKKVNADADLSVEQAVNVAHLLAAAVPTIASEIDPINDNKNENENNDINLNTRELITNNKLQNNFSNDNPGQSITTTITDENHDISTYRPTATNPTNYVTSLNAYLLNDAIEEPYQEKVNLPFKINIISDNNDADINDINDQIINDDDDDDNNNNNNNNEIETKINVMLPQPFSLPVVDDSFGKKLTTTTTLTTDDEISNLIKDINSQAIIDTKHSIGVRSLKNHRNLRRKEFLFKADAITRH